MARAKLIRYNLYLKRGRDPAIIDWLAEEENASRAIRERLSRTFGDAPSEHPKVGVLDVDAIREAVIQALDDRRLTLGDVRQVVDAALEEALSGFARIGEAATGEEPADDWLDDLDGMIIE